MKCANCYDSVASMLADKLKVIETMTDEIQSLQAKVASADVLLRERFIVRREYKDMTLYAYAHHHGFFTWGVKQEAVKLDTKLEAEALIASMSLANDKSVSVEAIKEQVK